MSLSDDNSDITMDILSFVFFLIAGAWLLSALLYSLLVLCFMRLQSTGQLGSIYDDDFGRVALPSWLGSGGGDNDGNIDNDETRWYIPLGCIFRRYARHLNVYDEGERPTNTRYFSRSERRAAMEAILESQSAQHTAAAKPPLRTTTKRSSIYTRWGWGRTGDSMRNGTPDGDRLLRTPGMSGWSRYFQSTPAVRNVTSGSPTETGGTNINDNVGGEETTANKIGNTNSQRVNPSGLLPACLGSGNCQEASTEPPVAEVESDDLEPGVDDVDDDRYGNDDDNNSDDLLSTSGPICSICLGELGMDEENDGMGKTFSAITCTHAYHEPCILAWLQRRSNTECPCCRVPLVSEEEVWSTVKRLRQEKRKRLRMEIKNAKRKARRHLGRKNNNDNDPSSSTIEDNSERDVENNEEAADV